MSKIWILYWFERSRGERLIKSAKSTVGAGFTIYVRVEKTGIKSNEKRT